jgi:DNA-binding beta-propeller fold protein YncE
MPQHWSRRRFLAQGLLASGAALLATGCGSGDNTGNRGRWLQQFGRHGISPGRFTKPRGVAVDAQDQIYIVDLTARIQVFDRDYNYVRHWQTPSHEYGRPTGLSVLRDGNIWVPDTHYYQILKYSPTGELLQTIGGKRGPKPGEFHFVTDVAELSTGELVISEYGEWDRIHLYSRQGEFIRMWGGHGSAPGEFLRPQSIIVDEQDQIWVADACNHRIQVFDKTGKHLHQWGEAGAALGQLNYPYSLCFDREGNLDICEFGNHRVQKFTRAGKSLGAWGQPGQREQQLNNPWSAVTDSRGRTVILDSMNHRVQVIEL